MADLARSEDELRAERLAAAQDHIASAFGHRLADGALLARSLTHASRCGAHAGPGRRLAESNERLEFLGDALLGAALCDLLVARFADADEGQLSRWKSNLASRQVLARIFDRIDLEPHALVGPQVARGSWSVSVKANLVEAVLGAIHLDGGWPALKSAVARLYESEFAGDAGGAIDPRMVLQEWCLAQHQKLPDYVTTRAGGSEHEPMYEASATIAGRSASGSGSSRRRAEAAAASALVALIRDEAAVTPGNGS